MFLVQKTNLTSHFKLTSKKPSPLPKTYQLAAKSFDEKIISHLKTLDLTSGASGSQFISLNWMSKAVTFLSTVHVKSQEQISNLRSDSSVSSNSDCYHDLYMDYSQKVLDLSNLISSAVQNLTERRLLLNLSLRLLLTSSGEIPAPEKLKKAKDALNRSVQQTQQISKEKATRAKDLLGELTRAVDSFPVGKISSGGDLIRRTLHALGALTVFVTGVLVTVLYGTEGSDLTRSEFRVPAEFMFADSVNGVQKQVLDLIKPKEGSIKILEVEDTVNCAVAVCGVIDEVVSGGGGGGGDGGGEWVDGVKELGAAAGRFSNGVDELTNGVNGLFNRVMKTRNGVLDGVRKGDW